MQTPEESYTQPLFTIGIVADILGVTQVTLRTWEKRGLIEPRRLGKNRYYSHCDLDRLREIKRLLRQRRLNIAGAKDILARTECWEVKQCGPERYKCSVYLARTRPERSPLDYRI